MKYMILVASCVLAACALDNGGVGINNTYEKRVATISSVCQNQIPSEIKGHLIPGTFDVEIDVEDIGAPNDGNFSYYATCHGGQPLTYGPISGPGRIEFKSSQTPTVFVRLAASSSMEFKGGKTDPSEAVDLSESLSQKPKPGDWPKSPGCQPKKVTAFGFDTPIHYIMFSLCAPNGAERGYYYTITLRNSQTKSEVILDPQIIHHP